VIKEASLFESTHHKSFHDLGLHKKVVVEIDMTPVAFVVEEPA
jgi:hypothetical protein